jgi:hypothetical protein
MKEVKGTCSNLQNEEFHDLYCSQLFVLFAKLFVLFAKLFVLFAKLFELFANYL